MWKLKKGRNMNLFTKETTFLLFCPQNRNTTYIYVYTYIPNNIQIWEIYAIKISDENIKCDKKAKLPQNLLRCIYIFKVN